MLHFAMKVRRATYNLITKILLNGEALILDHLIMEEAPMLNHLTAPMSSANKKTLLQIQIV
jgi:hypothetical protein